MSPLRNTMRFIDRKQRGVPVGKLIEEVIHHQPLWRDIQQLYRSAATPSVNFLLLFTVLRGVKTRSAHTVGL